MSERLRIAFVLLLISLSLLLTFSGAFICESPMAEASGGVCR